MTVEIKCILQIELNTYPTQAIPIYREASEPLFHK